MKESYGEGVAIHAGLESCGPSREGRVEASTEVRVGRVLSRENAVIWGADAVGLSGRRDRTRRKRETRTGPARSETLRTHGTTRHGNREIPGLPRGDGALGRSGKPTGVRR
jgi:hypothetical protein